VFRDPVELDLPSAGTVPACRLAGLDGKFDYPSMFRG